MTLSDVVTGEPAFAAAGAQAFASNAAAARHAVSLLAPGDPR